MAMSARSAPAAPEASTAAPVCESHTHATVATRIANEPEPAESADLAAQTSVDGAPTRESLLRALQELEASEARVRRNAERVYDDTRRDLIIELLPVLDNLDRTLDAAITRPHTDPLIQGVRMVHAQLEQVLRHYGVERIDATGKRFDPAIHEALAAVPVTDPALVGMVMHQAEAGYRFRSRMLRAAKVTVGVAR